MGDCGGSDPAALDESRWKTIGLLGKMHGMAEGACMVGETATATDGTHPTEMHSWFSIFLTKLEIT